MILKNKTLYIVAIPIGNVFDFSQRAILILKNVSIIATEDSRKTGLLLKFLNIKNKILSLNKYNEIRSSYSIINHIKYNKNIALLSDAGTPLINDPGSFLLNFAYKNKINVIPIPGVSSITTSLSLSKFKIKNFTFYGFTPKNINLKKIFIKKIFKNNNASIFFETPKRIINTLNLIINIIGNTRELMILKDLTKNFEKIIIINIKYLNLLLNIEKIKNGEISLLINKKMIYKKIYTSKILNLQNFKSIKKLIF